MRKIIYYKESNNKIMKQVKEINLKENDFKTNINKIIENFIK